MTPERGAVFSVSLLGKPVTQSSTLIFWNIVKLSACMLINTCSTDLALILVQELSGFCSQEFNPFKEINADNKLLLLPWYPGKPLVRGDDFHSPIAPFMNVVFYKNLIKLSRNGYMNPCIFAFCQNAKI